MIQDGIRNNDFLPLNQLNLIENLYKNNQLEISLTKDSKIRAILFIITNRNNSLLWIDLYDKNSYTSTLYNYISYISVKSFDSDICINFGRGAYKWKMSKFRPDVGDLFRLNIFSNNWFYVNHIINSYIIDTLTFIYRRFK